MFKYKKLPRPLPKKTIEVFVRHCNYSSASAHKKRPVGFDKKLCHQNLLQTADERVRFTYFLDVAKEGKHFIEPQAILLKEGTESGTFLRMIEHVEKQNIDPDAIVYFVEDDYLHKPGWVDALFEGFSLPADYVTLYDHFDKYTVYPKLRSQIFATQSCHWRTTPSTTNTYAMRFSTFKADLAVHRRFSLGSKVTKDHDKFVFLGKKGRVLVSALPGFSTHAEPEFASPCIHWEKFFEKGTLCTP